VLVERQWRPTVLGVEEQSVLDSKRDGRRGTGRGGDRAPIS
jgi:hypothetical protein